MTIGRGEHIRAVWRALRAAGITARIYNLYRQPAPKEPAFQEIVAQTLQRISEGIRIFHLNGDELARAIDELEQGQPGVFRTRYNIAFPAWELPRYPVEWARQLGFLTKSGPHRPSSNNVCARRFPCRFYTSPALANRTSPSRWSASILVWTNRAS